MRFNEANVVQKGIRAAAGTPVMGKILAKAMHHLDGPVLRRTSGRHSVTSLVTGLPIVELTATGAKTGQARTLPIIAVPDGDRLVLIASNYGQDKNPGWYFNLVAHPRCSVAFRGERQEMEAYEAQGEERERLWALDDTVYPARRKYAERASHRVIPVMVLRPV